MVRQVVMVGTARSTEGLYFNLHLLYLPTYRQLDFSSESGVANVALEN